jgi:hypothetical protein
MGRREYKVFFRPLPTHQKPRCLLYLFQLPALATQLFPWTYLLLPTRYAPPLPQPSAIVDMQNDSAISNTCANWWLEQRPLRCLSLVSSSCYLLSAHVSASNDVRRTISSTSWCGRCNVLIRPHTFGHCHLKLPAYHPTGHLLKTHSWKREMGPIDHSSSVQFLAQSFIPFRFMISHHKCWLYKGWKVEPKTSSPVILIPKYRTNLSFWILGY